MSSQGDAEKKCGWLKKQGGVVKNWHRRWFVLNGEYLFYFQKDEDIRPLGVISLQGKKIVQHPANPDEPDKFLLELMPGKAAPVKVAPNHETFLLSASSDEERQDWIKAIRKNMFFNKGGAIFGSSIEETMTFERKRSKRKVPYIVETCISFLIANGLDTEGIFRLPGRMLLVRDLKDRFDEGEMVDLDKDEIDVHSVASLLKQYFRELPESIIPYSSYQEFMNIAMRFQGTKNSLNKLEEVEELRKSMASQPPDNYNVLKFLCSFLNLVSQKTAVNKMTVENLARVFGPNIIRHPHMGDNPEVFMLTTADISEQLAYMLINYHDKIFTIEFDSGRKSANVAVDDLLKMDSEEHTQPTLAEQRCSAMTDLSSIILDQKADRRGRTFNGMFIGKAMEEKNKQESTDPAYRTEEVARSNPSNWSYEGKPIPPIRKKNLRKKPNQDTDFADRDGSISSENSMNGGFKESSCSSQRSSLRDSVNEPNTQVLELRQKLDTATAEYNSLLAKFEALNASKLKADSHVKSLNEERQRMQDSYDAHIKQVEARHKEQMNEICKKLDQERNSCADALQRIMELQKTLENYQMKFGDIQLPPLYQTS